MTFLGIRINFNDVIMCQLVRTGVSFNCKERTVKNGVLNR